MSSKYADYIVNRFKKSVEDLVRTHNLEEFGRNFRHLEDEKRALCDQKDLNWKYNDVKYDDFKTTIERLNKGESLVDDLAAILEYADTSTFTLAHKKEIALILHAKYTYKFKNEAIRKAVAAYLAAEPGQIVVDGGAGGSVVMQVRPAGGVGPVAAPVAAPAPASGAVSATASGAAPGAGPAAASGAAPGAGPAAASGAAPGAGPAAASAAAARAMQKMEEAKAKLDVSVAESKKALETYEKASRDYEEAVKVVKDYRKRTRPGS
jgi:hypothetical protein